MNKKIIFSIIGVAIASIIVFIGFTQFASRTGNIVTLEQNFSYNKMPSWDKKSVTFLEKEKWEVYQHEGSYQMKQGEKEPVTFNVSNKDRTCNIVYTVGTSPEGQALISNDYYLTYNRIENEVLMDNVVIDSTNTDNTVFTTKGDANLQMFTVKYSKKDSFVSADGTMKSENVITATRTFAGTISNPFVTSEIVKDTETGEPVERKADKVNANISITYSCQGEELDTKLWDKVLENSVVIF